MIGYAIVFAGTDPASRDGQSPRRPTRIGGLTLTERICHQLAKAEVADILVVGPESPEAFLTSSRRPKANIQVVSQSELPDNLERRGGQVVAALRGDRLYDNSLVEQVAGCEFSSEAAVWMDDDLPIGIACLSAESLAMLWGRTGEPLDDQTSPARRLGHLVQHVSSEPNVEKVIPNGFWLPVERPEHIQPATNRLFKSLTKPIDGWVSRNLNRPLSTRVTRLIVNLPITPHPISFVVFAIGMSSVYFALKGGYLWMALSGIIFQLASVLDGVDGELARVKFLATKAGALLDSILDHIIEVGYIGGVGWTLTQTTGSPIYFGAFVSTLVCALIATGIVNYEQATKTKTGAPMEVQFAFNHPDHKHKLWARIIDKIRFLFGRDFYALLFAVLTLINFPYPIPLLAALATAIYLAVVLVGKIKDLGKSGQQAENAANG